jgi:hypothetical protein
MKIFLSFLLLSVVVSCVNAQNTPGNSNPLPVAKLYNPRRINFHRIGKDSVNLSFNDEYNLIEDSDAQIIRYAHYNFKQHKFTGRVKDISKVDSILLTEGNYTDDGLKDGLFISHYLNGNLQSRGTYKKNKYDGHWEIYYENAKPQIVFEAINDTIQVISFWDAAGKKIIDNGKGTYIANLGSISWKGKLDNGKPDGTWHAFKTNDISQDYLAEEYFKKGKFQKGSMPGGSYTDASRIILIDPEILPYLLAENFRMAAPGGIKHKQPVFTAPYINGGKSISQCIEDVFRPFFSRINIKEYTNDITFEGVISESGAITNIISPNPFDERLSQQMISELRRLPLMQPATIDGKPVKEKIIVKFTFYQGIYQFSYRLMAIKQANL